MMRNLLWLLFLILIPRLPATSMVPLTLPQLEAASERIVIATTLDRKCVWQGKKIVTVYTLQIADSIKGAATSTVQVVLPGGSVKEPLPVAMNVPGVPVFYPKQRVLLFLQKIPDRAYTVTGWVQGAYPVQSDAAGEARVDVPSMVRGERLKAAADRTGAVRLGDFTAEIRRVMADREAASK